MGRTSRTTRRTSSGPARSWTRTTTTSRRSRSASSSSSRSQALKQSRKGPILCFVGPPGVGKTSLGRSIARALDRKFVRLSLGGVRDEAEIRGHRRTYVGAHAGPHHPGDPPGRHVEPRLHARRDRQDRRRLPRRPVARRCSRCSTRSRTSPSATTTSASPYDLSKVLFIATANMLDPIQPAFLDRMEVIRLSGYTLEEKKAIARRHLIPKQMEENGITEANVEFTDARHREDHRGVHARGGPAQPRARDRRDLPQGRRRRRQGQGDAGTGSAAASVEKMLGPGQALPPTSSSSSDQVGVATGLAWTSVGGDILFVEALAVRGKGGLRLTGPARRRHEGVGAGGAVLRARPRRRSSASRTTSSRRTTSTSTCPEGAIPKDGPSAGITMADGDDLGLHAAPGAARRRDDGRDHAARRGPPDRRRQGEGPRGPRRPKITTIVLPKMNRRDVHADLAAHPARHHVPLRREHGRGPGDRPHGRSRPAPPVRTASAERTSETPAREIPVSAASRRRAPPSPRA